MFLDFEAWYPSKLSNNIVRIIRKRLERTSVNIKVNDFELAVLLFVTMEDDEIKEENLEGLLPTMKDNTQKKPKITDQILTGSKDFRTGNKSVVNPPSRKPTELERKKMIAIAMAWIVKKVMTNFLYTFGGENRRQKSGGPIGQH